jgi:hypothetical protein
VQAKQHSAGHGEHRKSPQPAGIYQVGRKWSKSVSPAPNWHRSARPDREHPAHQVRLVRNHRGTSHRQADLPGNPRLKRRRTAACAVVQADRSAEVTPRMTRRSAPEIAAMPRSIMDLTASPTRRIASYAVGATRSTSPAVSPTTAATRPVTAIADRTRPETRSAADRIHARTLPTPGRFGIGSPRANESTPDATLPTVLSTVERTAAAPARTCAAAPAASRAEHAGRLTDASVGSQPRKSRDQNRDRNLSTRARRCGKSARFAPGTLPDRYALMMCGLATETARSSCGSNSEAPSSWYMRRCRS